MTEKKLIEWFNNYFDNCYYVKHNNYPESLFMFYDINYVRQLKIAKLEGKNIEKNHITGVCLFELNWERNMFNCDYDLIMLYVKDNYSPNFRDFYDFINNMLLKYHNSTVLTPIKYIRQITGYNDEQHKLNNLVPSVTYLSRCSPKTEFIKKCGTII